MPRNPQKPAETVKAASVWFGRMIFKELSFLVTDRARWRMGIGCAGWRPKTVRHPWRRDTPQSGSADPPNRALQNVTSTPSYANSRERQKALQDILEQRVLILDGAMGTMLQQRNLTAADFGGSALEGCNEILLKLFPAALTGIALRGTAWTNVPL